jgi:hypothetical protein
MDDMFAVPFDEIDLAILDGQRRSRRAANLARQAARSRQRSRRLRAARAGLDRTMWRSPR